MNQRSNAAILVGPCLTNFSVTACGSEGGGGGSNSAESLCDEANTYAYYVSAMNGQQGVQPNGDDLKIAFDETTASAETIAAETDGPISDDAKKMTDYYWSKMSDKWSGFVYDTRKVTQADLAEFNLPGYQQPGERVLAWTVDTCGDKIKPFPQRP